MQQFERPCKPGHFRFVEIFFFKFGFGLFLFSCVPSFNLLLCLELVKKFSVVVVVGGGVESNFSVICGQKD